MADNKARDPNVTPGDGVRVMVKFGTVMRKKKGSTTKEPYTAFVRVTKRVAGALNLRPASFSEYTTKKDDRLVVSRGSQGAKSVKVDNPTKPGYYMSLPVPGNANIEQIGKFLAPSKANRFSLGGGFYPCPGEEAAAANDGQRASAAQEAKEKKQ